MKYAIGLIILAISFACTHHAPVSPDSQIADFQPPPLIVPEDNAYSPIRAELGRELFFDRRLSLDSSISCSSCHIPNRAFSDTVAISPGVNGELGFRNSPSLINIGYHPYFMREGGVPTLEQQVLVPIEEHAEMAFNIVALTERLASDPVYSQMAQLAYNRPLDPYVITRAIANFERTLIGGTSAFDSYMQGTVNALNESEKKGMNLFFSDRTQCASCHGGYLFSSFEFAHNAQDTTNADLGRARLTGLSTDRYLFKVPSLRNVGLTAPYFHDGSFATLQEVLAHYNMGGSPLGLMDERIRPLGLSDDELRDLEAFLHSLTDE